MDVLLAKINKLEPWHVACIIAVIGVSVFFTGLTNPFQGDDTYQIVNNPPVHSLSHIVQFFESSTFYNGDHLSGNYYRPLMTVVFSIIYTFFGLRTFPYHLVQLVLYLSSAFVLYLVFKHFLRPVTALLLVLIFVVHPLNSQIVYSIPTMQDALFFLFGILALWLLIRDSSRYMWQAAACLLLAMLSKESGIVFTVLAATYLLLFDRHRLRAFIGVMLMPLLLYFALKIHAVGLNKLQRAAPIDNLNLVGRIFTMPSIIAFYLKKFIFPSKLATGYYWVYPHFSLRHVLLPLLLDLSVLGAIVYFGFRLRRTLAPRQFYAYVMFAAWAISGMALYLQIIRLDMTACETWFYFSMAGLLGMIGVTVQSVKLRLRAEWLAIPIVALICAYGLRSAYRGADYKSQYILAQRDIAASPGDYAALGNISQGLIDQHNYKEAVVYAKRSIAIYPVVSNYNNLGVALEQSGDYTGAAKAYLDALQYNNLNVIYENLGLILIMYSDPTTTSKFFQKAITIYPNDFRLRLYLAIFEDAAGNKKAAKSDIQKAAVHGDIPPYIYANIMNGQPFALQLLGKNLIIQ